MGAAIFELRVRRGQLRGQGVRRCREPHTLSPPRRSESIRLPKNFHPVGVSYSGTPSASATRSTAPLVGIERATALRPPSALSHGMAWAWAAMSARLSEGVTKNPRPRITAKHRRAYAQHGREDSDGAGEAAGRPLEWVRWVEIATGHSAGEVTYCFGRRRRQPRRRGLARRSRRRRRVPCARRAPPRRRGSGPGGRR